ncbi:MAG: hypothetical protein C5B53_00015 [Candidatus Melainabacteria bacterium]|nr:MAG: hypothetical protein C5B53_00015 [Candidatus Melainabacteria bacterium]
MVEEDHAFEMKSVSGPADGNGSNDQQMQTPDETKEAVAKVPASSAGFFVAATICFLLWLAFLVGWRAAMVGLDDTATCRLLALGRYMLNQRTLPVTDPFSYTFALQHLPYVDYQWLSEIILFSIYKIDRLKGLLPVHALLVTLTFVGAPLVIFRRMRVPSTGGCLVLTLALLSASGSFYIKSEVFSLSLLFLWSAILLQWRIQLGQPDKITEARIARRDLLVAAALFVVMLIWSNLHVTFLVGFFTLTLLLVSEAVGSLFLRRHTTNLFPLILGLFAAFLASLINPKGIQLWSYVTSLILSPVNQYVRELQPIALADFGGIEKLVFLLPFLILSGTSLYCVVKKLCLEKNSESSAKAATIYSVLLISLAFAATFLASGALPFAIIILLCELAFLMGGVKMDENAKWGWLVDLENGLRRFLEKRMGLVLASIALLSLHGAYTAMAERPPTLPQGNKYMKVPADAIKLLTKQPQRGKLLNDAHYGDILTWYLPAVVPVFIDTRYSMYGPSLVQDYMTISSDGPGTEELIQKYDFDWAFFPAQAPISRHLRANHSWSEVYDSPVGSIFRHNAKN